MRLAMRRPSLRRTLLTGLAASTVIGVVVVLTNPAQADDGGVSDAPILGTWEAQSLNGVNNNPNSPRIGSVNTQYLRIGPARYADGRSQPVSGPSPRSVSN